jgi:hypothetical protein
MGVSEKGGRAGLVLVLVGSLLVGAGLLALEVWQETRIHHLGTPSGLDFYC